MAIETQKYIRKPLYVDAVRVTAANFEEIAAWCNGEIMQEEVPGKGTSKRFIKVEVQHPKNPRQTKAMVGDWLLATEKGFKVYTNKAFEFAFDPVEVPEGPMKRAFVAAVKKTPAQQAEDERAAEAAKQEEIEKAKEPVATTPQGEPIEIVAATPEAIAEAVNQNEIARERVEVADEVARMAQEEELHTSPLPPTTVPVNSNGAPTVFEGKRILSEREQQEMGPIEVAQLLRSGDVVLAQEISQQ